MRKREGENKKKDEENKKKIQRERSTTGHITIKSNDQTKKQTKEKKDNDSRFYIALKINGIIRLDTNDELVQWNVDTCEHRVTARWWFELNSDFTLSLVQCFPAFMMNGTPAHLALLI